MKPVNFISLANFMANWQNWQKIKWFINLSNMVEKTAKRIIKKICRCTSKKGIERIFFQHIVFAKNQVKVIMPTWTVAVVCCGCSTKTQLASKASASTSWHFRPHFCSRPSIVHSALRSWYENTHFPCGFRCSSIHIVASRSSNTDGSKKQSDAKMASIFGNRSNNSSGTVEIRHCARRSPRRLLSMHCWNLKVWSMR